LVDENAIILPSGEKLALLNSSPGALDQFAISVVFRLPAITFAAGRGRKYHTPPTNKPTIATKTIACSKVNLCVAEILSVNVDRGPSPPVTCAGIDWSAV